MSALRWAGVGAGLALASCALPPDLPPALALLCAIALPVGAWLAWRSPVDESGFVVPLFVAAVATRVGVALVAHYGLPSDAFALDQNVYQRYGLELAEKWAGRGAGPEHLREEIGYYAWNALVFTVFGYVPLAATLPNAVVAGLSAVLAYRIARDLAGDRAGRIAGCLTAFFPSLVLWSSLNLKDAAAILVILTALRGAQRLAERLEPTGAVLVVAGLCGLSQIRHYLVMIAAISCAVSVALPRLRGSGPATTLVVWAALAAAVALFPGPIESLVQEANLDTLEEHRHHLALGATAYGSEAEISTPAAALRFLPLGLAYFLLAPAPWQLWNARQWLTLPEMLVWYALVPQVLFGLRHALRRRTAAALPIATFALLGTVAYALVEANVGTAYRHRAQVLVLYLVFAAVGLATRRERRAEDAVPRLAEVPA